ncbi:hypothetical protein XENTR_v10024966, partial [Xenopus tropicalis]
DLTMGNDIGQPEPHPVCCLHKHESCGPWHDSLGREKATAHLLYSEHYHVTYTRGPGVVHTGDGEAIRNAAAVVIQAHWRGYWARKRLRERNRACWAELGTTRARGPKENLAIQDREAGIIGVRRQGHKARCRLIPPDASGGRCGRSDNRGYKPDAPLEGKAAALIQAQYRGYQARRALCQHRIVPSSKPILQNRFTQTKPDPVPARCHQGPKEPPWGCRRKDIHCQTSVPRCNEPEDLPSAVRPKMAGSATQDQGDQMNKIQVLKGVGRAPAAVTGDGMVPVQPGSCKSILKYSANAGRDKMPPGGVIMRRYSPPVLHPKKVVTFNIALPFDDASGQLRGIKLNEYDARFLWPQTLIPPMVVISPTNYPKEPLSIVSGQACGLVTNQHWAGKEWSRDDHQLLPAPMGSSGADSEAPRILPLQEESEEQICPSSREVRAAGTIQGCWRRYKAREKGKAQPRVRLQTMLWVQNDGNCSLVTELQGGAKEEEGHETFLVKVTETEDSCTGKTSRIIEITTPSAKPTLANELPPTAM